MESTRFILTKFPFGLRLRTSWADTARRLPAPEEWRVFGFNHGKVGALAYERLRIPEAVTEVVRLHHRPDEAQQLIEHLGLGKN